MVNLPHRDKDQILTLYTHCFEPANVMLEDFYRLQMHAQKLKNPRRLGWKLVIYHNTWLGFLGVTCEGFKKVKPRLELAERPELFNELIDQADTVNSYINIHHDSLREFRNAVFHLREEAMDTRIFFGSDPNSLQWAKELHDILKCFFSEYRVVCTEYYIMLDRTDEQFGFLRPR